MDIEGVGRHEEGVPAAPDAPMVALSIAIAQSGKGPATYIGELEDKVEKAIRS